MTSGRQRAGGVADGPTGGAVGRQISGPAISARKPWRRGDAGVIVYFRLTPKSSKDAVDGLAATAEGPAFQARVRAPPVDGAANAALERLAAGWLDVPKRSVALTAGGKSRLKTISIAGDHAVLENRLEKKFTELNG